MGGEHSMTVHVVPSSAPIPEHGGDHLAVPRQSNGWHYFTQHTINAPPSSASPRQPRHHGLGPVAPSRHHHPQHSSLFGHDYIKNWAILKNLYSADYYSNISNMDISKLPFLGDGGKKHRGSDCPSDISSLDSRRKKTKHKSSKMRRLFRWLKWVNAKCFEMVRLSLETLVSWCHRFQKWQKWLHEQPLEVKEKYFFVASTIISTVVFYILFLSLDLMIQHWFALPQWIVNYSFSISYCVAYLTSVLWQHFFNQYFVFAMGRDRPSPAASSLPSSAPPSPSSSDAFCDSLLQTFLVYGCSLLMTGILGSVLQIYFGIADEFVLVLTLPLSGIMNYYLLRYCHRRERQHHHQYHAVPTTDGVYGHNNAIRGGGGGGGGKKQHRHSSREHKKYHLHHHHHSGHSHKKKKAKGLQKNGKYKGQSLLGHHAEDIVIV